MTREQISQKPFSADAFWPLSECAPSFPAKCRRCEATHILSHCFSHSPGQHEAGNSTGQDVEQNVHDPRAGGRLDGRTEGAAQRTWGGATAATYLFNQQRRRVSKLFQ